MVHACGLIVAVSAQVSWQMVAKIDHLGHVLHLIAESLSASAVVDQVQSSAGWPEAADAAGQVLILWRRAVTLNCVQVELRLVRRTTNAPLVYLRWYDATLISLLLVQWPAHLVVHLELWGGADLVIGLGSLPLIRCSQLRLLRRRLSRRCHVHLLAIATGLWPSLYLILDVLSLLFVGLADREALAHLKLLRAIQ